MAPEFLDIVIHKERPALTGILWAVGAALVIGAVAVMVNCIDILLSHRLSYSKFVWSSIHRVAVALLNHGLAYSLFRAQDWSGLSFGVEWFALTMGAYYLLGRRFPVAAARHRFVLGFALGFLVASLGVTQIVGIVLFLMASLARHRTSACLLWCSRSGAMRSG